MKLCKDCAEFMCGNSGINTYSAHCKSNNKLNICVLSPNKEVAQTLLKKLTKDKDNSSIILKDEICISCRNETYFWARNLESLKGKCIHILYIDTIYSIEDYLTKIIPLTDTVLNNEIHFFKRKDRVNYD